MERISDETSATNASSFEEDLWVREALGRRSLLQASIPKLVRKPTFPPLPRLVLTLWRFGSAFLAWKVLDQGKPEIERKPALYTRIRRAAERQGPTYVKLAQLISAAEGVFPEALVDECRRCRDRVEPESWRSIKKVLTRELGPTSGDFRFDL